MIRIWHHTNNIDTSLHQALAQFSSEVSTLYRNDYVRFIARCSDLLNILKSSRRNLVGTGDISRAFAWLRQQCPTDHKGPGCAHCVFDAKADCLIRTPYVHVTQESVRRDQVVQINELVPMIEKIISAAHLHKAKRRLRPIPKPVKKAKASGFYTRTDGYVTVPTSNSYVWYTTTNGTNSNW